MTKELSRTRGIVDPLVLALVKKEIGAQLGIRADEIKDDEHVVNDLGADSLDTTELVMALEDEFGLDVPDEEAEKWTCAHDAARWFTANRAKTASDHSPVMVKPVPETRWYVVYIDNDPKVLGIIELKINMRIKGGPVCDGIDHLDKLKIKVKRASVKEFMSESDARSYGAGLAVSKGKRFYRGHTQFEILDAEA